MSAEARRRTRSNGRDELGRMDAAAFDVASGSICAAGVALSG